MKQMSKAQYEVADAVHIAEQQKIWERVKHAHKTDGPSRPGLAEEIFEMKLRSYWCNVACALNPEIARYRSILADDFEGPEDIPTVAEYLAAKKWVES